jgi:mannose-1-phosphate guanylyltransferase / mannose-6-phosphate isomerase|tara:strand:+ start:1020 stop:2471 length:1452 start_codon:yes stop_codon:yes gene_type:complete
MKKIQISPVILSGGSGSRLWPLSREEYPKQFLNLSGSKSLFQDAIDRIVNINNKAITIDNTIVVTNEKHRFLVLDQLDRMNLDKVKVLLEPASLNTAPALTLASFEAETNGNDPILVVVPADQTISDNKAFSKTLESAIKAATNNSIVILGIKPNAPNTGYGYIKTTDNIGEFGEFSVERFIEKPNLAKAKEYFKAGHYFWNGGIFVVKASIWLKAINQFRSDIYSGTNEAWLKKSVDGEFIRPDSALYKSIPADSIDFSVIEKCPNSQNFNIQMIPLAAGWNDLGSWEAFFQSNKVDEFGNVSFGDSLIKETKNSLIYSTKRLVSTLGVENLIIVETDDALLVADKSKSQDVKILVEELKNSGREEHNIHRKVHRPWGWYDNIDYGEGFKVKRIQVKPGASLSLQMHEHRAEHWVVVRGVAKVVNGKEVITLLESESTYIPKGQSHRLSNPGPDFLEIIEVQSGKYLEEDDIIRMEDNYGRD